MAMPQHRFPPKASGMGDRLYADEVLNDTSLARGPAWKPSPPTVGEEEAERMGALGNGSAYVPYSEGEKPLQDDPIGNALVGAVGPAVGKVAVKVGGKGLGKLADVLKSMMHADADDISGGIIKASSRAPEVSARFETLPMGPGHSLSPGADRGHLMVVENAVKDAKYAKDMAEQMAQARVAGLSGDALPPLPMGPGSPLSPGAGTLTPSVRNYGSSWQTMEQSTPPSGMMQRSMPAGGESISGFPPLREKTVNLRRR